MIKQLLRFIRRMLGKVTGGSGGDVSQIGIGFIIERIWEHGKEWMKNNPRQAAHMLSYLAQEANKRPSPQTKDLFQDALSLLGKRDKTGNLQVVLGKRLQTLKGTANPGSRLQNRAQAYFKVVVTHVPEDASVFSDDDKRQLYVEKTADRLEMYARMDDPTWNAWKDAFNFDAPEKEHWLHRISEVFGNATGIDDIPSEIRLILAEINDDVCDWITKAWRTNAEARLVQVQAIPTFPWG